MFLHLLILSKGAFSLTRPEMSEEDILNGLLEALIPSDGTPGAKEAGLYRKLSALISQDSRKKRRYDAGLSAVRKEIAKEGGETVDWDTILNHLSHSPFFQEIRSDAMRLFYSDPLSWKTIGYEGPPIVGYEDYHRCG